MTRGPNPPRRLSCSASSIVFFKHRLDARCARSKSPIIRGDGISPLSSATEPNPPSGGLARVVLACGISHRRNCALFFQRVRPRIQKHGARRRRHRYFIKRRTADPANVVGQRRSGIIVPFKQFADMAAALERYDTILTPGRPELISSAFPADQIDGDASSNAFKWPWTHAGNRRPLWRTTALACLDFCVPLATSPQPIHHATSDPPDSSFAAV